MGVQSDPVQIDIQAVGTRRVYVPACKRSGVNKLIFDREAEGVQDLAVPIQERDVYADIRAGVRFPEGGIVPDDLVNHVSSGNRLGIVLQGQTRTAILLRDEPAEAHFRLAERPSICQSIRRKAERLLPVHQVDPLKGHADAFQGLQVANNGDRRRGRGGRVQRGLGGRVDRCQQSGIAHGLQPGIIIEVTVEGVSHPRQSEQAQ